MKPEVESEHGFVRRNGAVQVLADVLRFQNRHICVEDTDRAAALLDAVLCRGRSAQDDGTACCATPNPRTSPASHPRVRSMIPSALQKSEERTVCIMAELRKTAIAKWNGARPASVSRLTVMKRV